MERLPQTSCLFTHETLQTTPSYRQPRQQQRDRHYHQCTDMLDTMVRNTIYWYKGRTTTKWTETETLTLS